MFNTHVKGQIAELKVQLRAVEKGMVISKPIPEARYDLVLDDGTELLRAQVKYVDSSSKNSQGAVMLHLGKKTAGKTRVYQENDFDILLAYLPRVDKIVRLPVEMVAGKRSITIRLEPVQNGQTKNVLFFENFIW